MQIKGTLTGEVKNKHVVANEAQDGKTLLTEIRFGLTEKQAAKALGDAFAEDAFGSLRNVVTGSKNGEATERLFTWGVLKPTKKMVFENHRVTFTGDVFRETQIELQPKLLGVKTIEGTEKIIVRIRLAIPTDRRKLSQNIEDACGSAPIKIKFEPMDEVTPDLPAVN